METVAKNTVQRRQKQKHKIITQHYQRFLLKKIMKTKNKILLTALIMIMSIVVYMSAIKVGNDFLHKDDIQKLTENLAVRYRELKVAENKATIATTEYSTALENYNVAIESLNTFVEYD